MTYLSSAPVNRKQSFDASGQSLDPKFQTKAHLMKVMENLINIDSKLLLSKEIGDANAKEMVNTLETDTSSSG